MILCVIHTAELVSVGVGKNELWGLIDLHSLYYECVSNCGYLIELVLMWEYLQYKITELKFFKTGKETRVTLWPLHKMGVPRLCNNHAKQA